MMGSTAAVQAAEAPPVGTVSYAGTVGTGSPKDIRMLWEGTCTNPGGRFEFFAEGTKWAGIPGRKWAGSAEVDCEDNGTYRTSIMVTDYEDRGMHVGENFEYRVVLTSYAPYASSELHGTATL
jgi:hypothetical protein